MTQDSARRRSGSDQHRPDTTGSVLPGVKLAPASHDLQTSPDSPISRDPKPQGSKRDVSLPDGLLLSYYGDDFTGSTDAMEAMTAAGLPTLLCLETPTADLLARFPAVRCVGLAGSSRGRDPAWMEAELPAAFASLA